MLTLAVGAAGAATEHGPLSLTTLAMILGMFGTIGAVAFFLGRSSGKIVAVEELAKNNTLTHKECQSERMTKESTLFSAIGRLEQSAARQEGKLDLICKAFFDNGKTKSEPSL